MPLLQLNNVEVKYMDVILVLRGVSLQVEKGSVVALLGNNGAGKTTTLKAISGLLKTEEGKVTDGTIEFEGKRIENGDPEKIARLGIIQVLEGRMVLEHLTVEENLRVGAYIAGNGARLRRDLDMVYGYFPLLKELRGQTSGYLSGGEQQMLVVGRALMPHPKLILLDEASLGLAPLLVEEIFGILKRINEEEKVSMLLVEQNARAALSLAQHGYVMENGRIVLDGTGENLRGNADIREFYMGLGAVGETKSYRDIKHYKRRKHWLD
jgi:branched-chain amino acid transport system ATP-binding protein